MCAIKWIYLICFLAFIFMDIKSGAYNWTCGIDTSRSSRVYEGIAEMETYPWMGMLYYPIGKKRYTTAIILVTKQMVIASALEVDRLPKQDFRKVARVVIGEKCNDKGLMIRDYTYHPDFSKNVFSSFAMVQLEDDDVADLTPICSPPEFFIEPEFYAMTVTDKCKTAQIRIFKMEHVKLEECKAFYRRSDLDIKSFWPTHTVCARASTGGKCLWRSGTALVVKQGRHWRLLGFGVYGPGCQDPARFMDYGMYHEWVYTSVARVGRTAITRIAPNHLVMRRKMSSVQRFGPCDPEETKVELFTDAIEIVGTNRNSRAIYNLSLYASHEYSCIVFRAQKFKRSYETTYVDDSNKTDGYKEYNLMRNPQIYLRRWCAGPPALCYGFQFLEVHFYVEIFFSYQTKFSVKAYGKIAKIIDPAAVMEYRNKIMGVRPVLPPYRAVLGKLIFSKGMRDHFWFYHDDYDRAKPEPKMPIIETPATEENKEFDLSPPIDEGNTTIEVDITTKKILTDDEDKNQTNLQPIETTTEVEKGDSSITDEKDKTKWQLIETTTEVEKGDSSITDEKDKTKWQPIETTTEVEKGDSSITDEKDKTDWKIPETTTVGGGFVPTEENILTTSIGTTGPPSIEPFGKKKKKNKGK